MSEICNQLNIPNHLHRNDRPEDPKFVAEGIYRRFKASGNKQDWLKSRTISASIFQVNEDSCVREKYSGGPEDVLYNTRPQDGGNHYLDWGVLKLDSDKINNFSESLNANNEVRNFSLQVIHKPEECMYPHSEIIVIEDGKQIDPRTPRSIKALIRDVLIDHSEICKIPDL